MIAKVLLRGLSADSPNALVASVELPEGWRRVWTGALKPGDRYLNRTAMLEKEDWQEIPWVDLDYEEAMNDELTRRNGAMLFECLIRRGAPVEEACERCEVAPRHGRNRFCSGCCWVVRREQRTKSPVEESKS